MRIGTIGCGDWGKNHARTLAGLGVLAAVADADPDKRAAAEAEFGAPGLTTEALLADPSVDGVVIALPPTINPDVALSALAAGKHVLVEKPMAMNSARAEAIVTAAEAANRVAMTGHVLRFHPGYRALEDVVASGALGAVRYVHATRLGLGKFFANTDVMWDIAPHDLSILLAIMGEAPQTTRLEGIAGVTDVPDFAHLHLGFGSGAKAHVFVSRLSPKRERRVSVIGAAGMAVLEELEAQDKKHAVYRHKVWREDTGIRFENAEPEYISLGDAMPLTAELEGFMDAIKAGHAVRASAREGLDVIRALEMAAEGAA